MGATANLSSEMEVLNAGMDSVVIRHYVAGIIGGRTLDVSKIITFRLLKPGTLLFVIRQQTRTNLCP